jgi:soluble lytic murein transglycosylase-like protein
MASSALNTVARKAPRARGYAAQTIRPRVIRLSAPSPALRRSGGSALVPTSPLLWLACVVSFLYAASATAIFSWLTLAPQTVRTAKASTINSPHILPSVFLPATREAFIRQLNFERRREAKTQINFVTQKISALGKLESEKASALARAIVAESKLQNIDPLFVTAVIKKESTFKVHATSNRGATGLMQLMPNTGKHLLQREGMPWQGADTLRDPALNIRLGISYLKQLKASFRGNHEHALIAYNWGPANLNRALKSRSHIPTSTIKYARGVLKDHQSWSADLKSQRAQYRFMSADSRLG